MRHISEADPDQPILYWPLSSDTSPSAAAMNSQRQHLSVASHKKQAPQCCVEPALVVVMLALAAGCNQRQDGWKHYATGGVYPSHTFAVAPTGSGVVVSSPVSGNGDIYQIHL